MYASLAVLYMPMRERQSLLLKLPWRTCPEGVSADCFKEVLCIWQCYLLPLRGYGPGLVDVSGHDPVRCSHLIKKLKIR